MILRTAGGRRDSDITIGLQQRRPKLGVFVHGGVTGFELRTPACSMYTPITLLAVL